MTQILAVVLAWLRDAFTEHLSLKALSLAFAVGLFAYLHGQEDVQDRTIPVGLVMRMPQEGANRELMTQVRPSVHVTVRGSARSMDGLVQAGVPPVELDLRDGRTKTVVFERSMFLLPPGIEIRIIDPPNIALEWQDIVTREIPLQASITGKPAEGFVVKGEPEVDPRQATVRGPISLVEVVQFARLAAFDVSGLTEGTYRRRLAIDVPPNRITYLAAQSATVTVTIARRVTEAKFSALPVEVVGIPRAIANPRTVNVTVIGPPEIVHALRAEQIVPRADLSTLPLDPEARRHGSTTVKLTVDVAHAEADIQPPSVAVRW
jgi:YbbR domain-containing protein